MNTSMLLVIAIIMMAMAFFLGRKRAITVAGGNHGIRNLNSLPGYYGTLSALWCGIPSLLILALWVIFDDYIIIQIIIQELPTSSQALSESELGLLLNTVANIALNNSSTLVAEPFIIEAADRLNGLKSISQMALSVVILCVAMGLALFSWLRVNTQLKARVKVENVFKIVLLLCASIAVFTTAGIVFSVIFESIKFFQSVPFFDFVFGLQWSPQMQSEQIKLGALAHLALCHCSPEQCLSR